MNSEENQVEIRNKLEFKKLRSYYLKIIKFYGTVLLMKILNITFVTVWIKHGKITQNSEILFITWTLGELKLNLPRKFVVTSTNAR